MKTVNKHEHKLSICTDRRFLKIHELNSFILPKTTCTLRTLYLFVFVHFICSCSCTRPWLVKCTTFFWLRTLNKFVHILDFAGFGRLPIYSALQSWSYVTRYQCCKSCSNLARIRARHDEPGCFWNGSAVI